MAQLRPSPCRPELMLNMRTTERVAWLEIAWDDPWWAGALLWWRDSTDWLTEATRSQCDGSFQFRSISRWPGEQRPWSISNMCGTPRPCWMLWPETLFNSDQPSQSAEDAVRQVMWLIGFCQTEMWQPTGPVSSAFSCREGEHVQRIDHCRVQQVSEDSNIVICHGEQLKVHAASALTDWLTHWLMVQWECETTEKDPKKKDDLSAIVYTRPRIYN